MITIEENEDWAETEFGLAELGDSRRTARLVEMGRIFGGQPSASIPQACPDRAAIAGAYRFFENNSIEPNAILESHLAASTERCRGLPVVLGVQDTTYLDWTKHPATTGLGPLATAHQQGLVVHSTLLITPKGRIPLGILSQQVWSRNAGDFAKKEDQHSRSIEDKESNKWLNSLIALNSISSNCTGTNFISVGDAESDVYDMFLASRLPGVDLLIRAAQNRRVEEEEKYLWARAEAAEISATVQVSVARKGKQAPRQATVKVRCCKVTLRPPRYRTKEKLEAVQVWVVLAKEENPPPGVEGLEWLLLTTCEVRNGRDALEIVEWYMCRWGIEVWHKVLKSGCKLESKQLESAEALKRCLALYSVIAWRIIYATMLARSLPGAPCSLLLDKEEWEALYCYQYKVSVPPTKPPSLHDAVQWIAMLGGFMGRKSDGEPGVTVLWRGFQRLIDLTSMYQILHPAIPLKP
ncbi:IS4 family transposase [Candidatus Chlorohelix sp.]|uniref:IS4 family transposase n=1 Tax=Candidatus Chlorohelix sp. TaxID=3139201 RepID=UPI00304122C0